MAVKNWFFFLGKKIVTTEYKKLDQIQRFFPEFGDELRRKKHVERRKVWKLDNFFIRRDK